MKSDTARRDPVGRWGPEQAAAILDARARRLARRAARGGDDRPGGRDMLVLAAGPDLYALELNAVMRVRRLEGLGAAPSAAPAHLGLSADAGRVREVFDLAALTGSGRAASGDAGCLVVLAAPLTGVLRADGLPDVLEIRPLDEADAGRGEVLSPGPRQGRIVTLVAPGDLFANLSSTATSGARLS